MFFFSYINEPFCGGLVVQENKCVSQWGSYGLKLGVTENKWTGKLAIVLDPSCIRK